MNEFTILLQKMLEHWAAISTALVTLLTALFGFYKIVRPRYRAFKKTISTKCNEFITHLDISKEFQQHKALVHELNDRIKAEFSPNHGSSLRDAIDRIEHQVAFFQIFNDLVAEKMEMCYWVTDKNGENIYTSKGLLNLLDIQSSEMLSRGWKNFIDEDEMSDMWAALRDAISDTREYRGSTTLKSSQDKKISVHLHAYPIINKHRVGLGYMVMITPV